MKRNNKGFTLAELLIVVAVIAVLVAVAIPTFGSQLEKSRQAVDLSNLRGAYAAAKMAVLNQDDVGSDLSAAKAAQRTPAVFWYDPDAGTLTEKADALTEDPKDKLAPSTIGKATTASVVANTDGIPGLILYTEDTLAKVDISGATPASGVVGTTDKGILVTFNYTAASDTYSISSVTFTRSARVANTLDVTAPTSNAVTTKKSGGDDTGATDFAPAGMTVTVAYDEGGSAGSAISYTGHESSFAFQTSTAENTLTDAAPLELTSNVAKLDYDVKSVWVTYEGKTAKVPLTITQGT